MVWNEFWFGGGDIGSHCTPPCSGFWNSHRLPLVTFKLSWEESCNISKKLHQPQSRNKQAHHSSTCCSPIPEGDPSYSTIKFLLNMENHTIGWQLICHNKNYTEGHIMSELRRKICSIIHVFLIHIFHTNDNHVMSHLQECLNQMENLWWRVLERVFICSDLITANIN